MRSKKNDEKGFTLIELLAVIVILAILVMLAIPAVTRYLTSARKGAFADNAQRAIEVVRNDVVSKGFTPGVNTNCQVVNNKYVCTYKEAAINDLLEKKLTTSPFGGNYKDYTITVGEGDSATQETGKTILVRVTQNSSTSYKYEVCMIDSGGNGFPFIEERQVNSDIVQIGKYTTANAYDCDQTLEQN